MTTTQELAVSGQSEALELRTTVEVSSAVAQPAPTQTVTRAGIVKRQRLTFARRMLHALAEAGQPTTTHQLQPLVGPTGGLIWTGAPEEKPRSSGGT